MNKRNNKGFTLLELLVVVLIFGILSAVVLPQYNKAVWRSRATSMLPILRSMRTSIDLFYIVQDIYPTKLNELDIDIAEYTQDCEYLGPRYQEDGCKANDYANLEIITGMNPGKAATPYFQFNKGPYRGAGFAMRIGGIRCYEQSSFVSEPKSFCEKLMGCTWDGPSTYAVDLYYTCPDL